MRFGSNHARNAGRAVSLFFILILTLFMTGCSNDPIFIKTNSPTEIYGEMYGKEIGEVQIDTISKYYNITNLTQGDISGVNYSNSKLIIDEAGVYAISSQFSFSDGANTEFHLGLGINGSRQDHCHTQRKVGTGGDMRSASFTCINSFNKGDIITVMIENVDNVNNPTIHSINLNIIKIGDN